MKELKSCPVPQCGGEARVYRVDNAHEDFDLVECTKCILDCTREAWQMMLREEDLIGKSGNTYLWPDFLVRKRIDKVTELRKELKDSSEIIKELEYRLSAYRDKKPELGLISRTPSEQAEEKLAKIREIVGEW